MSTHDATVQICCVCTIDSGFQATRASIINDLATLVKSVFQRTLQPAVIAISLLAASNAGGWREMLAISIATSREVLGLIVALHRAV